MNIQEKIYMWTVIIKGLNYDKDIEKLKNKLLGGKNGTII